MCWDHGAILERFWKSFQNWEGKSRSTSDTFHSTCQCSQFHKSVRKKGRFPWFLALTLSVKPRWEPVLEREGAVPCWRSRKVLKEACSLQTYSPIHPWPAETEMRFKNCLAKSIIFAKRKIPFLTFVIR